MELVELLAFLRGSGRAARPLVGAAPTEQGRVFWPFMFGAGLLLPWLLQSLSLVGRLPGRRNAGGGLVISLLVLMGGYFLRRTIIEAGRTSSQDARTTLWHAKR